MFASTMRELLSDVAASETFYTLVAINKPAPKRQSIQPFCKRQQNLQPRDAISSNTVTTHSTDAAATSKTRPGTQNQDRQGALSYVQIGDAFIAHSNIQESTYLYQDTPLSSKIGQIKRNTSLSVFRRPTDFRKNHGIVYNQLINTRNNLLQSSLNQNLKPAQRSQKITECSPDNIAVPRKFYWKGSSYASGSSFGTTYDTPFTRAKELLSKKLQSFLPEILDVEVFANASNKACGIVVGSRFYSGLWIPSETLMHINAKKILTVLSAIQHKKIVAHSVLVYSNNIITLAYVRKFGYNLETLYKNKYQAPGNISAVNFEPCGRSKQTEHVCFSPEQKIKVGQPILLPTLKPNIASNPKITQREYNHDTGYSNVEIGNMIFGSVNSVNFLAVIASSNNSCSRSQKRKVPNIEQKTSALDDMGNQRRFLQTQDLGTYAVDFILSNKRRVRRKFRYSSIQQRFLDWRILNEITMDISIPQAYKLAILSLANNSTKLAEHPMFAGFTKTLNDLSIKSFLCWLLSVTGFLRASNIYRIDDARGLINQGVLCLAIVAPKEKQKGHPVENPCQINPHTDPILCPVLTYTVYKEKVAHNLCPTPHVNNSMWTVNRLIRFVNDRERPLSVDSITRYINSIPVLIQQDQDMPIPKGKAIGATLAANSGVSSDDIVAHAFWSNYSIFDSYY
ncbi:hypothetical protein BB561_003430 [Smittium simulii]|uniref:Uncharacterized protein n=1 Tax=Smittium simulii TaxID=133385 RepID=A0A2T9YLF9_9FUNG|nr:hypothetical protein BB561_003430 [Smittium simulii]